MEDQKVAKFTLRLDEDLHKGLKILATIRGTSLQQMITEAIEEKYGANAKLMNALTDGKDRELIVRSEKGDK